MATLPTGEASAASATPSVESMIAATRQSLATLHVQLQAVDAEAEAIASELTSPPGPGIPPIGISDPLVDSEGYPRADVDLYRARSLRGRLAELKTDRLKLADQTERYLHQLARLQNPSKAESERHEYAARLAPKPLPKYDAVTGKWVVRNWDGTISGTGRSDLGNNRSFDRVGTPQTPSQEEAPASAAEAAEDVRVSSASDLARLRPFARVNSVAERSPAEAAGLKADDLILRFGRISLEEERGAAETSDDPLQAVGQLVPQVAAQRESVLVVVRRGTAPPTSENGGAPAPQPSHLELTLAPQPWPGRGLLGCHIVPYQGV